MRLPELPDDDGIDKANERHGRVGQHDGQRDGHDVAMTNRLRADVLPLFGTLKLHVTDRCAGSGLLAGPAHAEKARNEPDRDHDHCAE